MGKSDPILHKFYKQHIQQYGETALLGFTNNNWFYGDLYDRQIGNWDINSDWSLDKKYDTIISLRCPYFARDPEDFIKRCYNNLNEGGCLYTDWGLGDHWRFDNYKVGWVKNREHEYAYGQDNLLWSTVWDDSFLEHDQYQLFSSRIKKLGYTDTKQAIYDEVPSILKLEKFKTKFKILYNMISLWDDAPQLYIIVKSKKISHTHG